MRRKKSMVLDESDPDSRSAGSFFVNPVVDDVLADQIEHAARQSDDLAGDVSMPRFPADGGVKLAAGWLIERSGFKKGMVAGSVGLSRQHALAIVNRGGAKAAEVRELARRIRDGVRTRFGITLHAEPRFIGFEREL